MSFSDYWENKILDHILNDGTYTSPTIYIGLSTADPGDNGSGLAEPSNNGYVRVLTAAADWAPAASGAKSNTNAVVFPQATGGWGTVSYVCFFDASSNLLTSFALTTPQTIVTNDEPKFLAGQLTLTLD